MLKLDLALFVDAANTTPEGKLNLLGEFNLIYSSALPAVLASATLVLRLVGSPGDAGKHQWGIRQRDDDGHLLWSSPDLPLEFAVSKIPGVPMRAVVMVQIGPFMFPEYGTYVYEIVVDGAIVGGTEIHVLQGPAAAPGSS